jgi:hypothetical protein
MINYLFDTLPEYIAFQILTYTPHPNADMIKKHFEMIERERQGNDEIVRMRRLMRYINDEMNDPELIVLINQFFPQYF